MSFFAVIGWSLRLLWDDRSWWNFIPRTKGWSQLCKELETKLYCPHINQELRDHIARCDACWTYCDKQLNLKEPLIVQEIEAESGRKSVVTYSSLTTRITLSPLIILKPFLKSTTLNKLQQRMWPRRLKLTSRDTVFLRYWCLTMAHNLQAMISNCSPRNMVFNMFGPVHIITSHMAKLSQPQNKPRKWWENVRILEMSPFLLYSHWEIRHNSTMKRAQNSVCWIAAQRHACLQKPNSWSRK